MEKNNDQAVRLNTTLNVGHMLLSSISLLIVIITMWVNIHVKLATLEFNIDVEKEKHREVKGTQEKLLRDFTKNSAEMTKLLYEIKLELKDKADREAKAGNP